MQNEDPYYLKKLDEIWHTYDTDNDGLLDRKEAFAFLKCCLLEMTGSEPIEEDLERSFAMMSMQHEGYVTKEECFKFLRGFNVGN